MDRIPQIASAMQTVLGKEADEAAEKSGFVRRSSKLTGAKFVQTLVFTWLANAASTLEGLSQMAIGLGVDITPQGIDERFSVAAAECLRKVLVAAVRQMLKADGVHIPLLERFHGVYIQDSTAIGLPDALASVWEGCGNGGEGSRATLKVQVQLELLTGALSGPVLQAGRAHDRTGPLQGTELPAGALWLADLGYFSLVRLHMLNIRGVFWITRLQAGTIIRDRQGCCRDLCAFLEAHPEDQVDTRVALGNAGAVSCRLLAARVPKDVADERRRRLHAEAVHRGQAVSQARLRTADWTIYVTNAPPELLSPEEAFVLARARWQIEMLFKLWKSRGQIDTWRSAKPERILCEVYAKLLAQVAQHWVLLVGCWHNADRSLVKATQTVARHATALATAFGVKRHLCETLRVIAHCLSAGCRMNPREKRKNSYQLLLAFEPRGLA
jgi:hypothetical protein